MELETDASSSGTTRTTGPFASGFFAADPFAVDAFAAEASDAFAVDVFFYGTPGTLSAAGRFVRRFSGTVCCGGICFFLFAAVCPAKSSSSRLACP